MSIYFRNISQGTNRIQRIVARVRPEMKLRVYCHDLNVGNDGGTKDIYNIQKLEFRIQNA